MPTVGLTHHIKLAGHYYIVKPGSYSKRSAPQMGARFVTGDPDFNNLSIWQHWAQRCWIGGVDAELYADDAMYDEGVGVDTTVHEQATLSHDLARGAGANWNLGGSTNIVGWRAVIYNSALYVLGLTGTGNNGKLYKYDPSTDGWVVQFAFSNMQTYSIAVFDGKLFVGGRKTTDNTSRLIYASGSISSWTDVSTPSGVPSTTAVTAMRAFQQKLYVCYGVYVWRMKDDQTWDGNTVFYKANAASEANYITAMEVHLGFLYMASQNGHVHRTDGNSTFDIWNWDGQTAIIAVRSFDGKLFILTFEYTNTTNVGYGVLYQMSGSAVTQLKRWGHESDNTRIGNMVVYDRKLFYGASNLLGFGARNGFGVAAYDPVEDAHSIMATNSDVTTYPRGTAGVNHIVDDQIFFQGKLFVIIRGHGAFFTAYKPHGLKLGLHTFDTTSSGVSAGPQNGGWLTTSTYDAGTPGVRKLWRKIIVDYTIPSSNQQIVVEYSTNNGSSYTQAGIITTVGTRVRAEYWLNNIVSSSIKLRFTLRSTVAGGTPILLGYVVSYIPIPEPNWMWSFTIVLADKMVLLDNTEETVDTEAELTFLRNLWRSGQLVNFIDAESSEWAASGQPGVLIYDFDERLLDLNQPLEGEVNLTLLEAVETY